MLLLLHLPSDVISFIEEFDLYICVLLLIEWSISFLTFNPKTKFLKQKGNWLNLIASIPFDAFLPIFLPQLNLLRYFRLLKILRVIVLFNSLISSLKDFIQKTHIEKILFGIIVIIGIFTLIVWNWSNLNFVDSLYFVIETITSVGYGDITPKSINEKALTMVLIFIGVFVFSTITAVISSFFTDKLINDEQIEQDLQVVKKEINYGGEFFLVFIYGFLTVISHLSFPNAAQLVTGCVNSSNTPLPYMYSVASSEFSALYSTFRGLLCSYVET